jgi:hypothetical protein
MKKKLSRVPAIILIVMSVFAVLFWIVMLFFSFFLGGGTKDGRTVPILYVGMIALGLLGATLSLAAGIKGLSHKSVKALIICAAVLGIIGGVPFYLMDLTEMGLITLLPGVLPPLLYLLLERVVRSQGR